MPKSTKSRNGMGTVRQRADGRFEARYTGADGKQHSIYGHTSTEVTKALRAATSSVDTGDWLQPSRMTVSDWLDVYLRDYCTTVRPSTLENYKHNLAHVRPVIGSIKLTALSSVHIRRVISTAQANGLSPSTVHLILSVFSGALNCAVSAHVIRENPCREINLPKSETRPMHIIDRPQFPAFFDAALSTHHGSEIVFLLLTGLRIGELIGLTWSNVNFEKGEITISRQISRCSNYTVVPTKTGLSRTIVIPAEAVQLLRAQHKRQSEQRIRAGHMWKPDSQSADLVFTNKTGSHLNSLAIAASVSKVGDAIGLPGLHPHDLRHSYAVAALRSGVDVKTVQHNLGHTTASMTLDVYAKYTDDAGATASRLMSAYFSASNLF